MKAERWRQIDTIFHQAVELPAEQRSAFLDRACSADPSLRDEVEALIAFHDKAGNFLQSARALEEPGTLAGRMFGPYEIKSLLGSGGMGHVFLAEDSRLGRKVAIKLLKPELLRDSRARERFLREARSVSQLNHPHICTLHDIGEHEGIDFLVMEYLEGETLAARLERGPMLLDKALKLAEEIADALDTAHRHGVTHRDLKPSNVMLTSSGAKLVDFGLAKMTPAPLQSEAQGEAEAKPASLTTEGTILGTVHYMSPEQARGETNLTPQSDQFSFGLVLYEMVTGKRAFERPSAPEVITAIIREDAEPLPSTIPAPLRWVIERLLSKDPADRYDSTRDLFRDLRQIRNRLSEAMPGAVPSIAAPAPRAKRRWISVAVAIGALAISVVATVALLLPPPMDLSALKFTPVSRMEVTELFPAWSPDGKSIAFTANVHGVNQVFTKVIDPSVPGEAAQITNGPFSSLKPLWSPDGSKIYYLSNNKLWSVTSSGGAPSVELADTTDFSLHSDGKTVAFSRRGKLWVDSLGSNSPREFGQAPFPSVPPVSPLSFSPDGSKLIAQSRLGKWVLDYPSGAARKKLPLGDVSLGVLSWLPDNRHIIAGEISDVDLTSSLVLLDTEDGACQRIYSSIETMAGVALSSDGRRLAYARGLLEWNVVEIALSGSVRTVLGGSGLVSWWPDWAKSGTHFLATTNRSGPPWAVEDVSTTESFSRRLYTSDSKENELVWNARWSPDGSRFAFITDIVANSQSQLRIANSAGGRATSLVDHAAGAIGMSWSPDGRWIAYAKVLPLGIAKIRSDSGSTPEVLVQLTELLPSGSNVEWSPAGDWIAYTTSQGVSLISPETHAIHLLTVRKLLPFGFSKDGRHVFGIERDTTGKGAQWQLYEIDVATGVEKLLNPVDLPASVEALVGFSMHPDGTRFLTSVRKWPTDIWIMEGFNPPKTWLDRLLRR